MSLSAIWGTPSAFRTKIKWDGKTGTATLGPETGKTVKLTLGRKVLAIVGAKDRIMDVARRS